MKFEIARCPKCGDPPSRAEHTTSGSHWLDHDEHDDTFEWGDQRDDSAECDDATCDAEAKDRVFHAACALVDAVVFENAALGRIAMLLGNLGAAVKEARTHDASCIVLWCASCSDDWHTRVVDEDAESKD
jgi:hypothetical protein